MALFDTVSGRNSAHIGNTMLGKAESSPKKEYKPITNEAAKLRAEEYARKKNAAMVYEENDKLQKSMPVMPGSKKVGLESVHQTPGKSFTTPDGLTKHAYKSARVFTESLTDALFVGKLAVINAEACAIDGYQKTDEVKKIMYEHCAGIFKAIRERKDIDKLVAENKVPSFVGELWELSRECAILEAKLRFDKDVVRENCGLDEEKINEYIQREANDLRIRTESVSDYFESVASQVILENEDVIDTIKGKIESEIDDYKKSAQKIASVKDAIRSELDEADKIPGTNGQKDEDSSKDDSGDSDTSNSGENTGGDENAQDDSSANDDKDDDKTPENSDGDGETDDSNKDEGNGSSENKDGDGEQSDENSESENNGDKTSTENEGDDPLENQQKLHKLSPEVTQELEDAVSFATNYSHTFNTGDEKFEKMRKRLSVELTSAMDNNDLNKMNEIKETVSAMHSKLQEVNAATHNKYKDMESKLEDMVKSTAFEIERRIENTTTEAAESRTMLEALILKVAKRSVSKAETTNEGFEFNEVTGKAAINEAIIYRTTMETFNTLKLYNPNDPADFENVSESIRGIKH